jgi:hypothetical protein
VNQQQVAVKEEAGGGPWAHLLGGMCTVMHGRREVRTVRCCRHMVRVGGVVLGGGVCRFRGRGGLVAFYLLWIWMQSRNTHSNRGSSGDSSRRIKA